MCGFCGMPGRLPCGGMCWLDSSGESTWSPSTPFSFPDGGSGALRHACGKKKMRVSFHVSLIGLEKSNDANSEVGRLEAKHCPGLQAIVHCIQFAAERITYLNKILALRLCHERLELWCGKGIHKSSLGNYQEQNLRAGQNRQLVGLQQRKNTLVSL